VFLEMQPTNRSISIPEPHVLPIRQVFESVLLALLLVLVQGVSSSILSAEHHIQKGCNGDQHRVASDDTFPNAWVLVADFLRSYPEGADDVT
jgi:hypothetical protein